jgi:hypothetical protein
VLQQQQVQQMQRQEQDRQGPGKSSPGFSARHASQLQTHVEDHECGARYWQHKHLCSMLTSVALVLLLLLYCLTSSTAAPAALAASCHNTCNTNNTKMLLQRPPHLHKLSTSSMKMMLGAFSRASLNSSATSFSLSPSHLETRSLLLMLKKVLSASVATACGSTGTSAQAGKQSDAAAGQCVGTSLAVDKVAAACTVTLSPSQE